MISSILGAVILLGCVVYSKSMEENPPGGSRSVPASEEEEDDGRNGAPIIIRQINKINKDGTYTYGYEAGDGTFKIETRDVLGNVKGTFGFIDPSTGTLKRVSYSANNETGFRTGNSVRVSSPETVPINGNRIPVSVLKNSQIQHIPKKSQTARQRAEDEMLEIEERMMQEATTTAYYEDFGKRNETVAATTTTTTTVRESTARPMAAALRKVLVSKRPLVEAKDEEKTRSEGGKGGNLFRRQLNGQEATRGEGRQQGRYAPQGIANLVSELRPKPSRSTYQDYNDQEDEEEQTYGARKYQPVTYRLRKVIIPHRDPYQNDYRQEVPIPVPVPVPMPYDQIPNPVALRDELLAIIYNYLQARLSSPVPPYYYRPYYQPPHPPPPPPPYQSSIYNPYPSYYPQLVTPAASYVPNSTPQPHVPISIRQKTGRVQKSTPDDADLLHMLLNSPTRMPLPLTYSSTEGAAKSSRQPVRNVQILGEEEGDDKPVEESSEK